ncbi:LPS translocon maturation chaperone LptM [Marinicella gelatinilytica]|uniref:LPS translocon maturation chaperone LptM n=1 Tax=Marinicella gelatinilytica TaxID=2996017 RepID=UPI002260FCD2|nr:lipoprotein [Marinicella gelatinilytica]MCX7546134.1 lipoprotein [Marinicella gelatinilytica]
MIIFTKKHRLKSKTVSYFKLLGLLLLTTALSGCGNKGDLYHPQDETTSQTNINSLHPVYHEATLSL